MGSITLRNNQQTTIGYKFQLYPNRMFIFTNPLSTIWRVIAQSHEDERRFLEENPHLRLTIPIALPQIYAFGIIGYALSLITRICGLVKDALLWVASIFVSLAFLLPPLRNNAAYLPVKNYFSFSRRSEVLLGSLAEVAIAGVGCACPPLAYSLDEWLQINSTINAHTFPYSLATFVGGPLGHGGPLSHVEDFPPQSYQRQIAAREAALDRVQTDASILMLREARNALIFHELQSFERNWFGTLTLTDRQINTLLISSLILTFVNECENHDRDAMNNILNKFQQDNFARLKERWLSFKLLLETPLTDEQLNLLPNDKRETAITESLKNNIYASLVEANPEAELESIAQVLPTRDSAERYFLLFIAFFSSNEDFQSLTSSEKINTIYLLIPEQFKEHLSPDRAVFIFFIHSFHTHFLKNGEGAVNDELELFNLTFEQRLQSPLFTHFSKRRVIKDLLKEGIRQMVVLSPEERLEQMRFLAQGNPSAQLAEAYFLRTIEGQRNNVSPIVNIQIALRQMPDHLSNLLSYQKASYLYGLYHFTATLATRAMQFKIRQTPEQLRILMEETFARNPKIAGLGQAPGEPGALPVA